MKIKVFCPECGKPKTFVPKEDGTICILWDKKQDVFEKFTQKYHNHRVVECGLGCHEFLIIAKGD
jgi:hypothetical protein